MNQTEIDQKIKKSIHLIKQGDKGRAKTLLMAVIEADEENELAWLWLSAAVNNDQDRITCLQNALTINPKNEKARARLIKIQAKQGKKGEEEKGYDTEGITAPPSDTPPTIGYQSYSNFDDIWTDAENLTLCAYCAHQVTSTERRCPNCLRKLTLKILSHTHVSPQFHMYWVMVLSLSQLMLIQVGIDLLSGQSQSVMILHGAFVPVFLILPIFIYRRHFWAYGLTQIALFLTAGLLISASVFPSLITSLSVVVGTPLEGLYDGASLLIGYAVRFLQTVASGMAFFLGMFLVGPDFSQDTIWLYARLNKELRGNAAPSRSHAAAERYAKRGMWATAILHWRRAQAGSPTELRYYIRLAEAYIRLNFLDRASDTIESGLKIATTSERRAQLQTMKREVLEKQNKLA